MRIGYCLPFGSLGTEISDWNNEFILALKKHMEVVIFLPVPSDNEQAADEFEIHALEDLHRDSLRKTLDLTVYRIGDNFTCYGEILKYYYQYPGVLELCDVGLHHLTAAKFAQTPDWNGYIETARYCHGRRGEKIARDFVAGIVGAPWESHAADMPMNRKVIEVATAIIVHSDYAKQMVLGCRPDAPITNIMPHSANVEDPTAWKAACRERRNVFPTQLVMGSFGFVTPEKRILSILDALKRLKEHDHIDFLYYVVGEPERGMDLPEQVKMRGLENHVCLAGFQPIEELKAYMGACDFCLNLRYPTQGESSVSLHRMLGMGKPVIVTDAGSFGDYPDEIVIKTRHDEHEADDIYRAIRALTDDEKQLQRRGLAALEFARKNCDLNTNAMRYKAFFEQILTHTWQPEYEDILIDQLCELGLVDKNYIKYIWESAYFIMHDLKRNE